VRVLSVDLGTSNSVAVLSAHERPPRVLDVDGASMMPSAVFATEDGQLVAGREAERRARMDPARFEPNPKRRIDEGTLLLGDRVIAVTDTLAAVLRKISTETSRQLGGRELDEVRLTHPAQWGPVRRNVLLSAARQAGLGSNLVLVPEPVAAAAHFASFPGQSLAAGQSLAVYDLGAGTFDVAVVGARPDGYTVLAEAGLPDLGGLDVDQALLQHVGRQVAHRDPAGWQRLLRPESTTDRRVGRALREDVRAAKEALSSHPQTDLPLPDPFDDVLVTRVELEALIRPNLLRSVELLASTVRATGLGSGQLAGVYLVGGSSRIPLVATLIAEHLRVVPTSLDQPETAVALGAHFVSREGVLGRTQNMASSLAGARAAVGVAAPPPMPPPAARPPAAAPPPQLPPQAPMHFPPPPPRPGSNKNKLLIGAAVLAVIAVAAVVTILAMSGGGGGQPGGGNTASNECASQKPDERGFTPCLKEIAGPVADSADCKPDTGANASLVAGEALVVCTMGDFKVTYRQWDDISTREVSIRNITTKPDSQTADWSGGGKSGSYFTNMYGGTAQFLWVVKDRPLGGEIDKTNIRDQKSIDELVTYFNDNIKPR
jgi:hypothetical protein